MAIIASDAASMLAEALEKMDGLISDDQMMMEGIRSHTMSHSPNERVLGLAEDLQNALIAVPRSNRVNLRIPVTTSDFLLEWLKSQSVGDLYLYSLKIHWIGGIFNLSFYVSVSQQ